MKSVFMVIVDAGDGSQWVEWHKFMSDEKIEKLGDNDCYQSGEGVQVTKLNFPEILDLDNWARINHITWWEDNQEDFCVD